MGMSRRWRIALALVGLALVVLALAALAYALWPIDPAVEQRPVPPTLFAPPQTFIGGGLYADNADVADYKTSSAQSASSAYQ